MTFKCAHLADIHFRGLSRHQEYREVFNSAFIRLKEEKPDVIFLGGDIVHSKTQGISPELIDILAWWFRKLSDIAPVHIILGNHDGLMLNEDRQDAITPIIEAIDRSNIKLFKKSGIYPTGIDGFSWAVFSCFDKKGWKNLQPVAEDINIAVFHGPVAGSTTDGEWRINGEGHKVNLFDGYEFAFLGDIHKRQFLNKEKTIAYCGSTIQQNYGEDQEKGFLIWEIKTVNEFSCKFIPLHNRFAFRTIDYLGDIPSTLRSIPASAEFNRFRIKCTSVLSQTEVKQLTNELREKFNATEVVFKQDVLDKNAHKILTSFGEISKQDLGSFAVQKKMMNVFLENKNMSDEEGVLLEKLHRSIFEKCIQTSSITSKKWRLRTLAFDNTFGYGSGNYINFESLQGIIGIFGKNRVGKSSIPGTIMYTLFNGSDRGSLKNIDIINNRKNYCLAKLELSCGAKQYRVERQTVKHTSRRGVVSAPTNLAFFEIDEEGNVINDLCGEQRRETEKELRETIGRVEDFMLTSFASQGEMNTFIKSGATYRKAVLSKFLGLEIFDKMLKIAKSEHSELKGQMKTAPDRDWTELISEKTLKITEAEEEKTEVEEELAELRREIEKLKIQVATSQSSQGFTGRDINEQQVILDNLLVKDGSLSAVIRNLSDEVTEYDRKIEKVELLKKQFPLDDLKQELLEEENLRNALKNLEHKLELQSAECDTLKKLSKKLDKVPCGDQFPKCVHIKDAHISARRLPEALKNTKEIKKELKVIKKSYEFFLRRDNKLKLERYESIIANARKLREKKSNILLEMKGKEANHESVIVQISQAKETLREMKLRSLPEEASYEIDRINVELRQKTTKINGLDSNRMFLTEQISILKQEITKLSLEKEEFGKLKMQWNVYNTLIQALDQKGIPFQIISNQLPLINEELRKILQGIVNFNVELSSESSPTQMDILIDYGDSKRLIECASGMEKMMTSLAMRVALINTCNLPKGDILIIDEGFGALDDKNLEACSRLLESFRKWFSHIFLISHIDAVKDIVDFVIDIQKIGKDSKVYHE